MSGSKVLVFVFFLCCLSGFLYQVVIICETYFEFDTITKTELQSPDLIETPVLSVCFSYGEIFDYDGYRQTHPNTTAKYEDGGEDDFAQLKKEVTIADIFTHTPRNEDVLQACFLRRAGKYFRYGLHPCERVAREDSRSLFPSAGRYGAEQMRVT